MKKIPVYKFYKHKYGDELLVDVISYEKMMPNIRRTLVFSETFYSITLVLEADATVAVNGKSRRLKKGLIICSIPGEVWSFEAEPQIEALNLIFEKEFLLSFFSDPHFLERFSYLQAERSSPFLMADEAAYERILALYQEMRREITDYAQKDQHILRVMLYETMMLLQRVPMVDAEQVESVQRSLTDIPVSRYVDDFVQLVSDHFREEYEMEEMLRKLASIQPATEASQQEFYRKMIERKRSLPLLSEIPNTIHFSPNLKHPKGGFAVHLQPK